VGPLKVQCGIDLGGPPVQAAFSKTALENALEKERSPRGYIFIR
jgi:hypothetical protein